MFRFSDRIWHSYELDIWPLPSPGKRDPALRGAIFSIHIDCRLLNVKRPFLDGPIIFVVWEKLRSTEEPRPRHVYATLYFDNSYWRWLRSSIICRRDSFGNAEHNNFIIWDSKTAEANWLPEPVHEIQESAFIPHAPRFERYSAFRWYIVWIQQSQRTRKCKTTTTKIFTRCTGTDAVRSPHDTTTEEGNTWKKVNRKVQKEPKAEVAANPWHQEEEKKWHRLKCA